MTRTHIVITLNGRTTPVPPGTTVAHLVAQHLGREITPEGLAEDGRPLGLAVAVGEDVLARSQWASTVLDAGDAVEIVTAVQGG